jgi:branched-chain amino acid transport system ATP-binding protein
VAVLEAPTASEAASAGAQPLLRLNNVEVIYDRVILVLKGLSLEVPEGKIVALLGANGAGKSTTLKAISGLLKSEDGEVTDGSIELRGRPIHRLDPADIVRLGVFQVMEGRRVFEHLTVEENLRAGAHTRGRANLKPDLELVYHYFPRLLQRRQGKAGYLSGGEQQMLAIGRALMAKPKLVMLDEPSLGLSPLLVQEVFGIIQRINRQEGITILLVEQNARLALSVADYAYLMESGRIVLDGEPERLRDNEDVKEFYLGLGEMGQRKSYRDVKHYKRRKRWLS